MKKKQVLVTVERGETRVAILEQEAPVRSRTKDSSASGSGKGKGNGNGGGWQVAELYIERPASRSIVGNIYKGQVANVVPGLEAAFIDIGLEKNGFLHVDDVGASSEGGGRGRTQRRRSIGDLLKRGQDVVVQAIKDPLKTKGPRVTMQLAVPGRYMVYVPEGEGVGVSRRLPDSERARLRKIASALQLEKGGAIVRTAARGAQQAELAREVGYLLKLEEVLNERTASTPAPNLIFQEADLPIRVLRDLVSKEFEQALIDDEAQFQRVLNFFKRTAPELADQVKLYNGSRPLFEAEKIEEVIRSTLSSRVNLPSGGYLIIDYTEAMTVIDVNTGSFTGRRRGSLEDTITRTNLEAAREVVRQLRLRDIGGIIVIDFIDMERVRNRNQVLSALNEDLDEDRTKTYVMEISPLGLVEMTRENVTDGVREIMTDRCHACGGEGVLLSSESVAIDVERKLRTLVKSDSHEAFLIQVNAHVAEALTGKTEVVDRLEQETGRHFYFEGSANLPVDTYAVIEAGTQSDLEQRVLPFRTGDEVMLRIDEPHMYNEQDAVAKFDNYVVVIAEGNAYVGERVLVRIEEVTRKEARASLAAAPAAASAGTEKTKAAPKAAVAESSTVSVESPADAPGKTAAGEGEHRRRRWIRHGK